MKKIIVRIIGNGKEIIEGFADVDAGFIFE